MLINVELAKIFWLVAILFGLAYFAQRWRLRRILRKRKQRFGFYPNSAALGNALQALQTLVQPSIANVLEEELDEHADEDDSGDDKNPFAHLHRQAARIRKGDPPDHLTVPAPRHRHHRSGEET